MPELVADPYPYARQSLEEMVEVLPELIYLGLENTVVIPVID